MPKDLGYLILAVFLLGLAVFQLRAGEISGESDFGFEFNYNPDDSPFRYYGSIAMEVGLGLWVGWLSLDNLFGS